MVDRITIAETFARASLGSPRNAIGFVMWRVMHRYERELERALTQLDLTHLQFTILALVAWTEKEGGAASQAELARFGDVHVMQLSNVLKALEHKGMIDRSQRPGSGRAKTVAITREGLETLGAAFPLAVAVQQRMFGDAGRPKGPLLTALVLIDGEEHEGASPAESRGGGRPR